MLYPPPTLVPISKNESRLTKKEAHCGYKVIIAWIPMGIINTIAIVTTTVLKDGLLSKTARAMIIGSSINPTLSSARTIETKKTTNAHNNGTNVVFLWIYFSIYKAMTMHKYILSAALQPTVCPKMPPMLS